MGIEQRGVGGSVSEREYSQAKEAGAAARRGGKRIGDVPYRGTTKKVQTLREAWCTGFKDEDDKRKAAARAALGSV